MTLHHCNQCGGNMEVIAGEEGDFLRCVNSTEQDPHPNKMVNGLPVNKPKFLQWGFGNGRKDAVSRQY